VYKIYINDVYINNIVLFVVEKIYLKYKTTAVLS